MWRVALMEISIGNLEHFMVGDAQFNHIPIAYLSICKLGHVSQSIA